MTSFQVVCHLIILAIAYCGFYIVKKKKSRKNFKRFMITSIPTISIGVLIIQVIL